MKKSGKIPEPFCKRSSAFKIAAVLFFMLFCPSYALVEDNPGAAWSTHLYNQERQNISPDDISLPPQGRWSKRISSVNPFKRSGSTEFATSPAIYRDTLYVGSKNRRFYAVNLASGGVVWKFKVEGEVNAPATVTEDMVCFGSFEGVLHCVERETGREIWHFNSRGEINASPLVTDSTVYLYSSDNRVYALSRAAGEHVWTYFNSSPQYVSARLAASPALEGNRLFVMFNDGTLVCLDAKTGKEIWKKDILNGNLVLPHARRTPYLFEGLVYVIDGRGYIAALDGESGEEKARYDMMKATDFVVTKKRLYILGASLLSLNRATGTVLWKSELRHGVPYSMAATSEHIFILSNTEARFLDVPYLEKEIGQVTSYTAERGDEAWSEKVPKTIRANASIAGNHVAFVTEEGVLRVFGTK